MAQVIIVTNQREGKSSVRPYVPSRGGAGDRTPLCPTINNPINVLQSKY